MPDRNSSTIIGRLREAIDDPLAAVCTDHGGHRFPIPVSPETLAALLDAVEAAQVIVTECRLSPQTADTGRPWCLKHDEDTPCPMATLRTALGKIPQKCDGE